MLSEQCFSTLTGVTQNLLLHNYNILSSISGRITTYVFPVVTNTLIFILYFNRKSPHSLYVTVCVDDLRLSHIYVTSYSSNSLLICAFQQIILYLKRLFPHIGSVCLALFCCTPNHYNSLG